MGINEKGVAFIARIKFHDNFFFACPLDMNLRRRFGTAHGHPVTEMYPLMGVDYPSLINASIGTVLSIRPMRVSEEWRLEVV